MIAALSCGTADTEKESATTDESVTADAAASDSSAEPSTENVTPAERISVYAGTGDGTYSGDGGRAVEADIEAPAGITVDSDGNLFIATGHRVRRVDAETGIISTVAGTGAPGYDGDGGPATEAKLKAPADVAVDAQGNLFIADADNGRIRRVDAETGMMSTVAGGGIPKREGGILVTGDGGLATDAWFKTANSVTVDSEGNIYFMVTNRLRRVDAETSIITSLAGTGTNGLSGDGGASPDAGIADPHGVAVDADGNLYLADTLNQRIRRIDATTGIITTVAGIGKHPPYTLPGPEYGTQPLVEGKGLSGDGGPAVEAMLSGPKDVAFGPDGHLYIADTENDRVRVIDLSTGVITTVVDGGAESGEAMQTGFTGGGESKVTFENFSPPFAITLSGDGTIYLSDHAQNQIVKIVP